MVPVIPRGKGRKPGALAVAAVPGKVAGACAAEEPGAATAESPGATMADAGTEAAAEAGAGAAEDAGAKAAEANAVWPDCAEDSVATPRARMALTTCDAQKCTVADDERYGA